MNTLLKTTLFAAALAPALASAQSFGVVEISQKTLVNGNALIGDVTPGAPITISVPGHYRLSSGLAPGSLTAIEVSTVSGPVTLDLNGHGLTGNSPGCSSTATLLQCPPQGSAHGVHHNAGSGDRFRVANGTIEAFTGDGIRCSGSCQVDGITARANHGYGINIGGGVVQRAHAIGNGFGGILASAGSVSDSNAYGNGRRGIVGGMLNNLRVDMTRAIVGDDSYGVLVQLSAQNLSVGNTVGIGILSTGQVSNAFTYSNQSGGLTLNGGSASRVTASGNLWGIQVNAGVVRDSVMFNNRSFDLQGNPTDGLNICSGASC